MTVDIKIPPMFRNLAPRDRVQQVRRDIGKRTEHEAVLEDVASRQPERRVRIDRVTVEKQVDVQRPGAVLIRPAPASRYRVNTLDLLDDFERSRICRERHHQVQEILPLKPQRSAAVNR